jgi:hypothetical protein
MSRGGAGLSTPRPATTLDLEAWAQYILYHGRPGCPNPFVGLAFNYTLHLHYQSVFGHLLCRALAPAAAIAWAMFTRHFACIAAMPRRYHDLVGKWAQSSGQTSDFPDS